MSAHTICTTLVIFEDPEDDENDIEIEVEATYGVDPGYPERGPSYSSGGEPGQPPMVEDVTITLVDGKPFAEVWGAYGDTRQAANDRLADQLVAENECAMFDIAVEDDEPDWDAIREQREEDARDFADQDWGDDDYD